MNLRRSQDDIIVHNFERKQSAVAHDLILTLKFVIDDKQKIHLVEKLLNPKKPAVHAFVTCSATLRHKDKQDEISDKTYPHQIWKNGSANILDGWFSLTDVSESFRTEFFFFWIFLWLLQTKTRHSNMIELTSDLFFSPFQCLSVQHLQHFEGIKSLILSALLFILWSQQQKIASRDSRVWHKSTKVLMFIWREAEETSHNKSQQLIIFDSQHLS